MENKKIVTELNKRIYARNYEALNGIILDEAESGHIDLATVDLMSQYLMSMLCAFNKTSAILTEE